MNDPLGLFEEENNNDPLGLFSDEGAGAPKKAGVGTAIKSSFANVGNMADTAISTLAGSAAALFGDEKAALEIADSMEERRRTRNEWANPNNEELTFGGKVAGTLATLPLQVVGMGLSPAETSYQALNAGETNEAATKAAMTDAAMNAIGIALPAFKQGSALVRGTTGALAGAGQDYAAKLAIQQMLETEKGKALFEPTLEDAAVSGIVGGGFGVALGNNRPQASNKVNDILNKNRELEVSIRTPDGQEQVVRTGEQLPLFDPFEQRSPISPYQTEMASDMWRVDENGIPIRADLSMEAQNLQNPLQRNLFGDELDVNFPRDPNRPLPIEQGDLPGMERFSDPVNFRNDPENQRPLTEAIDMMPEGVRNRVNGKFAPGTTRQSALDLLRREMPASPELEVARMESNGFKFPKSQRGVVDPSVFLGDFPDFVASKIKDTAGQLKVLFRGVKEDYTAPDRPMLGTLGEGIYLTESKTMANNYARGGTEGRQVRAYYANVKNPYEMEIGSPEHQSLLLSDRETRKQFSDSVKANGFDGVVLKAGDELKEVMVFSSEQAKNAFTTPSKKVNVPKGQHGVIKIDWSDVLKLDNMVLDGKTIPTNPGIDAAIKAALKQGKDGKQWNYLQSGATSVAMKTGSPIIRAAEEVVQNAIKRADLAIRNSVFPAEDALRRLPKQELVDLGELMKAEMFEGKPINAQLLAENLSEKQLRAYASMRNLFDKTLEAQNAARVAKGQQPITAREAYMASRWQGDFRQPVYDAEGNLVWYLAAHSKVGLESQIKAIQKLKPDLVIDRAKGHVVKSSRLGTDLQSAYTTMLDILDPQRDKAAIQELKAAVEDQMINDGEMSLGQSKHFKEKSGVRGFAGDRPWMDRAKDITDMFQQQIQYAKNAFKWSEMQTVADDIKGIVSNEELQKQQPNNIKYIREYTKNALGFGEAQVTRALDDAVRSGFGVSPTLINNAVGNIKSFFITQKLAVSAGYTLSNLVQAGNVLPYLADMSGRGIVGNPLTTLPVGFLGGMAMGTSHYLKAVGGAYMDSLPNQFFKDAFLYAEENGVTARSVYDEAPIESGFSVGAKLGRGLSKSMTIPETFVRSVAFMTYAEWLRSSGKFPDQNKLFQEAERLVNMSMVDYRETERPLMFAKAGSVGNFLNTLQTYPMSFYNQWAYMLGQAAKGNPAGLAALAGFQFMIAGAMGMPFFDDMEKLYKWIRDNMVGDSRWTAMMKSPFFSDPKSWMIDNLGESAVYGMLSDKSGVGLTSRVAAPGAGAMLQSPIGPITDIAGQIGAVGKAALDPTDKTKVAQAAMKVAPVGLQGFLETRPFMKDVTYVTRPDGTRVYQRASDLMDRRGGYARTAEEDKLRASGLRSQREVLTRDVEYAARSNNQAMTKRGGEIVDKYYNAIRNGNYKKAKELNSLYIDLTGKGIDNAQLENQVMDEFLTGMDKTTLRSKSPLQVQNAVRARKILEENK